LNPPRIVWSRFGFIKGIVVITYRQVNSQDVSYLSDYWYVFSSVKEARYNYARLTADGTYVGPDYVTGANIGGGHVLTNRRGKPDLGNKLEDT
jgi:hypothetical protein